MFKKISLATSVALLAGCASMFNGSTQSIAVSTNNDLKPEKTSCHLANEEGSWDLMANSATSIHRDGNALTVKCDNDLQNGVTSLDPNFSGGYLVLDLFTSMCLGVVIDAATNALYTYPSTAIVSMKNKSGVLPSFVESKTIVTTPPAVENTININNNSTTPAKIEVIQDNTEYYKDKKQRCFVKTRGGKKKFVDNSYCQ